MATIRTVTVKSSGGDYSSAAAAEAGEQGDLVTLDRQLVIECYPMEDTTALSVAGYTVDATRNIIIRTPTTDRPNGIWTTSAYRLVTATGAPSINVSMEYTVLDGLQIKNTGNNATTDDVIRLYTWRSHIRVTNCVVTGGYHGIMAVASATVGGYLIANNVVFGTYAGGIRYGGSAGLIARAVNNTVYGCNTGNVAFRGGIENQGSYQEAINNLSIGNNGYSYKQSTGQLYNISSDATAAGTGSITNKSLTDVKFVSILPGSEDLHLQSGSVAIGAGTDLSSYITTDIDGQTRSAPWDIGADQYVAGGGSTYTETLTSTVASVASVDDRQTYLEAASVLIQSGVSVAAVQTMLETIITVAGSTAAVTDVAQMVEQCLTTVQSASSVTDAVAYVETLLTTIQGTATAADIQQGVEAVQTGIQSVADVADVAQLVESLLTTIQGTATVSDTLIGGGQTFTETVLVTATSAAEAHAAQSYVESVTAVAQGVAIAAELQAYLESLTTAAQAIASVTDRQLYYDNVTIMALSGASVVEIGAYIEQVQAAAIGTGSVVDALQGAFVGRYLFVTTVPPRSFASEVRPRSFTTTVRARC